MVGPHANFGRGNGMIDKVGDKVGDKVRDKVGDMVGDERAKWDTS